MLYREAKVESVEYSETIDIVAVCPPKVLGQIGDYTPDWTPPKEVREDDKIDVSLTPQGYQKVEGIAGVILEAMKTQGGYIPVHDKSDPDVIYSLFRCSKKAFKQAIGALYKQHLITLEDGGIRLVNEK